ncbi:MAG: hypothetical protein WD757_02845 [Actinomycetota bacterium]
MKRMRAFALVAAVAGLLGTGCTGNAEQGLETAGQAEDLSAQADLRNASVAAKVYLAENGTLGSFTAAAAKQAEPSINWTDGAVAVSGQISIRGPSDQGVALVTKDASGSVLCIGVFPTSESMGRVDAQTAAECTGGW